MSVLIELREVGKTFANGTQALAGMSLAVAEGEFVSLLGPSGCGKSTVLRMIAGLAAPSSGEIVGAGAGKGARDLGFVFQEPTLMPWATVRDNVLLPLRLQGVAPAGAGPRVKQALALVGLEKFGRSYPRELSGGMKMRVSIARALVTRPKLLLMDEPFAALDEMTRMKLNDDLLRLWREHGLTVVFVTHSVYESVYLSSRVVVMAARPGRVVAEETIDPTTGAPYLRDAEFRLLPEYAAACRRVSRALQGDAAEART
ncbi:MAG: nitrate/sulfonate/bicarbonate transporter ATP-binding protein [Betaproteobacteria bacterium]|nr:nitrate/sulfonate/bicarbonate transporter ATP-binding protein [Betaproteobacteria bacterium]